MRRILLFYMSPKRPGLGMSNRIPFSAYRQWAGDTELRGCFSPLPQLACGTSFFFLFFSFNTYSILVIIELNFGFNYIFKSKIHFFGGVGVLRKVRQYFGMRKGKGETWFLKNLPD